MTFSLLTHQLSLDAKSCVQSIESFSFPVLFWPLRSVALSEGKASFEPMHSQHIFTLCLMQPISSFKSYCKKDGAQCTSH